MNKRKYHKMSNTDVLPRIPKKIQKVETLSTPLNDLESLINIAKQNVLYQNINNSMLQAILPDLEELNAIIEIVKEIRESDCGTWLTDCVDGKEKRQELARLLDKLYNEASI